MSFPGISSTRAGAEPGRSGFPASYTSLLTYPLGCPAEGGFSGPLSERCCHVSTRPSREDGAGYPKGCPSDSIAPSAEAWKVDTLHEHKATMTTSAKCLKIKSGRRKPDDNLRAGRHAGKHGRLGIDQSRGDARPALDLPKGAFSPWVSASITYPGVRTSSPAPGAFGGHDQQEQQT